MAEDIEKIYVIPLKKTPHRSGVAAPASVKRVKSYLQRHMKVEESKIWIDDSINRELWKHGKYYMPNKIRVKAVKFDDGVVEAYLPELEFKKSRREILREEKAKKEPILIKEEVEEETEEETGAEDYEITPSADGDVKIKKKKTHAEKEKTEEKAEKKSEEKASEGEKKTKTPKEAKKPEKKAEKEVKKEKEGKSSSKTEKKVKKETSKTKKDKVKKEG